MKPDRRIAALTALFLAVSTGPVWAQTSRVHIGPHIGYNFKIEDPYIGVQASFPVGRRLEFYPSFDWYLVGDGASVFGANGDLKWRVAHSDSRWRWLYIGGGLNLTFTKPEGGDTDTRAGGNLFVGAESLRGRIHPFAEGRVTLRRGTMFQVQGGLNITL